ncbi:MAG: leucine-rich repeat protein [Clostridia bacterium]|nr:leucine-rich repeat protein [Clostridia bacterium]
MKRRILSIVLCLALLLPGTALLAQAAPEQAAPAQAAAVPDTERSTAALGNDVHVSGDWMYYADRESGRFPDRILIVKYTGSATDVTVPETIDGYTVGQIGPYAFSPDAGLPSYYDMLEINHDYSFSMPQNPAMTQLRSVTVPGTVWRIGSHAFDRCTALETVQLSEGLEEIQHYAFFNCPQLTALALPTTLTLLLTNFAATGISEIIVPASSDPYYDQLTVFGYEGLNRRTGVDRMVIHKNNVEAMSVGMPSEVVFEGNVSCFYNLGVQVGNIFGQPDRIVFRKGGAPGVVPYIGMMPLDGGHYIRHIDPDGGLWFDHMTADPPLTAGDWQYLVNSRNEVVLAGYTGSATALTLPAALNGLPVTAVADYAFSENKTLTQVTVPAGVTEIRSGAFRGCTALTQITLPESVTAIGTDAFAFTAIPSITLPQGLTELGACAFEYCAQLQQITLPVGVDRLGAGTFAECASLTSVALPAGLTVIGASCFADTTALEAIGLPAGLKVIHVNAFAQSGLRSVTLSPSLRFLGPQAFQGSALEAATLQGSSLRLQTETFKDCAALHTLTIAGGVVAIEQNAFLDCAALTAVTIGPDVRYLHNAAFSGAAIRTLQFNAVDCETNNMITLASIRSELTPAHLSAYASPFKGCPLESVTVGPRVQKIGIGMFKDQTALTQITLPASVYVVEEMAFCGCSALRSVRWYAPIRYVKAAAFWYCDALQSFNFVLLTFADLRAFAYTSFTELQLGATAQPQTGGPNLAPALRTQAAAEELPEAQPITAVPEQGFLNCDSLETVGVGGSITAIGSQAFADCDSLETAVIADTVTDIAPDAFDDCPNLTIVCMENSYAHSYALVQGIPVTTLMIAPIPNQYYTGRAITPPVEVSCSGAPLTQAVDYSAAYADNIHVGQAKVTVTGLGDYQMLASVAHFTIITRSITNASVAQPVAQKYTGSPVEPKLTVVDGGRTLRQGTDYTVYYKNNTAIGTASAYVVGIGDYSGTVRVDFEIKDLSARESFLNSIVSFFRALFVRLIGTAR